MNFSFVDVVGWFGAIAVLYGYFMVSNGRLKGDSLHFQAANITGAGCLAVYTYYYHAYPSTVLNVIWAGIALFAVGKKLKVL